MTYFDATIRLQLNDHGGVIICFDGFKVWNTIGGKWKLCWPDNRKDDREFDMIGDAFWAGMGWPEQVAPEKFIIESGG